MIRNDSAVILSSLIKKNGYIQTFYKLIIVNFMNLEMAMSSAVLGGRIWGGECSRLFSWSKSNISG